MSLFGGATAFQLEWIGTLWVAICLAIVASLVFFLLVAVWMYGDAERRGMNGVLWVLLLILASLFFAFLGGIVVLIVYLILRGGRPVGVVAAPYASAPAAAPAAAPTAPTTCKACGAPLHPNAAFCANCGSKV